MTDSRKYRGRFAPSPTGPLHFGSLVAAVGSYLDARHNQGEWLLRIEDLDPPREIAGAAAGILRSMEALGMTWDGEVTYQSRRDDYYRAALDMLQRQGQLYGCACTRKEIADSAVHMESGGIYPGTCRGGLPAGRSARALRLRVEPAAIELIDRLQGRLHQQLETEVGDFVVRRADKLVAYQLAVVVDDAEQNITHVVRGADLLDSTPRQVYLQQLLGFSSPAYLHLPMAVKTAQEKLSKQTGAPGIIVDDRNTALIDTLRFLNQPLPESPRDASRDELWQWAIAHWDVAAIPAQRVAPAPVQYSGKITRDR
jgi:glutamyl-Q tRNA(Asp) synthetase